jgi:hypothetical protein
MREEGSPPQATGTTKLTPPQRDEPDLEEREATGENPRDERAHLAIASPGIDVLEMREDEDAPASGTTQGTSRDQGGHEMGNEVHRLAEVLDHGSTRIA